MTSKVSADWIRSSALPLSRPTALVFLLQLKLVLLSCSYQHHSFIAEPPLLTHTQRYAQRHIHSYGSQASASLKAAHHSTEQSSPAISAVKSCTGPLRWSSLGSFRDCSWVWVVPLGVHSLTLNVYPLFPSGWLKGQRLLMEQWLCYSHNYLSLPLNSGPLAGYIVPGACLQSKNKGLSGWWNIRATQGPGNAITPFLPAPTWLHCRQEG